MSSDPFRSVIAANPSDQNYLISAYEKWKQRKNRGRASVVLFVNHDNGTRRYRILEPNAFRASMIRVGESAHKLATIDRQGVVYIEPEYRAYTPWYREFIAQHEVKS